MSTGITSVDAIRGMNRAWVIDDATNGATNKCYNISTAVLAATNKTKYLYKHSYEYTSGTYMIFPRTKKRHACAS